MILASTAESPPGAPPPVVPAQRYARIAGVLTLLSLVCGSFGELYVPATLIVPTDAAATAANLTASATLFRLGFAGYLVEAVCDVALALLLYELLRPVRRDVALLAAFFRIVSTATFAVFELCGFAALLLLAGSPYLRAFSPEQLDALALLALKCFGLGAGVFLVFYGVASVLFGWLIFRSGYIPRTIGALLGFGGLGFVISSFVDVLAPRFTSSSLLMLPMGIAGLALTVWFLVGRVDAAAWQAKAARPA